MFALIFLGHVVDISPSKFQVHKDLRWVEIPEGVSVVNGWSWSEGLGFSAPVLVRTQAQALLDVTSEEGRRISNFLPPWKLIKLFIRALELLYKGRANWTAADTTEWNAGATLLSRVKALRLAANSLEDNPNLTSLDVTDNQYWPE